MFNFFQQPWTLLFAALATWFVLLMLYGDRRLWWQSHLALFLAVAILAFDFLAESGLFNISQRLATVIKVVLALAIAALLISAVTHVFFTDKRHLRHWLAPIVLAMLAFGLDLLVKTDLEKINTVINTGLKAVEQENPDAIDGIIAQNYRDSYHSNKVAFMTHCRSFLREPLVEKNKSWPPEIKITSPSAEVSLRVAIHFEPRSRYYGEFTTFVITRVALYLTKQSDKSWLISRVEVLEVNNNPVNWGDVK